MGGDVTALLVAWSRGEAEASAALFPLLYGELRRIARAQRRARPGAELTTTELVHEAYLKLADASRVSASCRAHFFSLAARAMRQILVDAARRTQAAKRGRGAIACPLDDAIVPVVDDPETVLALHAALEKLATLDERMAHIVELRAFAGLEVDEVAATLSLSERTVKRDWRAARAFLYRELRGTAPP